MTKTINGYQFTLLLDTLSSDDQENNIIKRYNVHYASRNLGTLTHQKTGRIIPHPGGGHREQIWILNLHVPSYSLYRNNYTTMSASLDEAVKFVQENLQ